VKTKCPGCLSVLSVDEDSYRDKVLLQCPQCLYVYLAGGAPEEAGDEPAEEATLLTSDFTPRSDAREFQWNVPGASITIIEGDSQGVHVKLTGEPLLIGRKGGLEIEDKAVSREHCRIEPEDGGWRVVDLGSTNGTFVNNERVEYRKLAHLDEIKVGNTRVLFAEASAPGERSLTDRENTDPSGLDITKVDSASKTPELELPEGREFHLEFMNGPRQARSVKLTKGRVVIGRGEEADVSLDDQEVSRKHAMIEIHSRDQVYISDLASQNGVWLNGMRVRTTRLIHGDLLRLGSTVLKFTVQDMF